MAVDKNKAMIDYLITCPSLAPFKLFFNFGVAADNNKQLMTSAQDVNTNTNYVDGSVGKRYSITIVDFKSVGYNAIIKQEGYQDENVSEILEVQNIIDWISEQEDLRNYPDFGPDCEIESIYTDRNSPNLQQVDTSVTPALALYGVTIVVDYIDTSKSTWNK